MKIEITRAQFLQGAAAAAAIPAMAQAQRKTTASGAANGMKGSKAAPPRNRQIHLDFHTSELIQGIGEKFDKKQFQAALQAGKVNHINVFGKCHMSWSYYPTKIGSVHPHLKFDLLGAQLEACREIGVRSPIYFTAGWSAQDAKNHPEWCVRDKKGEIVSQGPWSDDPDAVKPNYNWKFLCVAESGPYHAFVLSQVEELCKLYQIDGFWMDIYHAANFGCHCDPCKTRMRKEGIDVSDDNAVIKSYAASMKANMMAVRAMTEKHHPEATVFFNPTPRVGGFPIFTNRLFDANTQQEIEDLPSAWGGYDKLPIESKYHLGDGSRGVAMSGKFHKAWGEFGGFKSAEALRYEAAAMISFGVACNFGDQLHPSGMMDPSTYRNIGEAYSYVEKIEDYGPGGVPYSKLGLWLSYDENNLNSESYASADRGASGILLESHYDYVIARPENLNSLDTILMASAPNLTPETAKLLSDWVAKGGRLVVLGSGALDKGGKKFLLDLGADYVGPPAYDVDYTVVEGPMEKNMVVTPFLNYNPAVRTKVTSGKVLATLREPYFSRTNSQYSGHLNTPYRLETASHPAAVQKGNVIYLPHPLDRMYLANGMKLHRQFVKNAIDLLGGEQVMKIEGLPSSGRVSLIKQADKKRYVAHLLYSPPLGRGDVQVIEDFPSIDKAKVMLTVPETVRSVTAIPSGKSLQFSQSGNGVTVSVPPFSLHIAIVFNV
jgi:Hypothetical glycosyl hydrolase 6